MDINISNMNILSIDDNKNNLLLIEVFSQKLGLNVTSVLNPIEALQLTKKNEYDLIVVDYMMPDMNGIDFIKLFRDFNKETPIIMITASIEDINLHKEAILSGATDFIYKPFNSVMFQARISNLLILRKIQNSLKEEVKKAVFTIEEREKETLFLLAKTAEYKDPETSEHVKRVALYSKLIAKKAGLNEEEQNMIFNAAPFHDIGKVSIPDNILLKPAKLTEEEFETMKKHTIAGYDILKNSKSKYLIKGSIIALSHHEKYDGTGYPQGLKGNEIPLEGRIVAISDVFDALTSQRPYKEPWSIEKSLNYIKENAGKHFDPLLGNLFFNSKEEIIYIYNTIKEKGV